MPLRRTLSLLLISVSWLSLVACNSTTESGSTPLPLGPILVLGDSIMAWNSETGTSIGHVLEAELGVTVTRKAVSGAHFAANDSGEADIRDQYIAGDWDWVVFDWGGNDVNDQCECDQCNEVINALLSSDGSTGKVLDFVQDTVNPNSKIVILSYYELPATAEFGFSNCSQQLLQIRQRTAQFADVNNRVYWANMGSVISPTNLDHYDADHVHPSIAGSALLGRLIADTIRSAESEVQ